jgi:hypothetical protein
MVGIAPTGLHRSMTLRHRARQGEEEGEEKEDGARRISVVQKILELQQIASNQSDAFIDYKDVTKSLNPAVNAPCSSGGTNKNYSTSEKGEG